MLLLLLLFVHNTTIIIQLYQLQCHIMSDLFNTFSCVRYGEKGRSIEIVIAQMYIVISLVKFSILLERTVAIVYKNFLSLDE